MIEKSEIVALAQKYGPVAIGYRRHLHMYPELSFAETNTSQYIKSILDENKIPYSSGWCKNGIVATVQGAKPGRRRAFRADMDALPILEENKAIYASRHEGIMHACGHDVHTACGLGTLLIINTLKDKLEGSIDFIFQPGEEKHPGGASIMLKEKALGDSYPEFILAQHVFPSMQVGKVGVKAGQYMASADELFITVKGKGGHAATPHNAVDPILISAHIITGLQQLISRNVDPVSPSVLTIGKVMSEGGATNIIPNEVKMEGTFRAMDEKWRYKAHGLIKNLCTNMAESMGGSCEVSILVGYPSLFNDETVTKVVKTKMIDYLGPENVEDLPIRLTAEDFAYFSQEMPTCFYRLGTGNTSKNITSPVHTPTFDIDEDAIELGIGLAAWLLL